MIPQETIEQVAAATDIVEVINSYVPLKRAGGMWKARCPFHQEKSPSFNVNPARQMFKCFGCGVGGSVFKFVTMFTSIDFPSAVRMLAERAGIAIVEEQFGRTEERGAGELRRRLLALHGEAAGWFHRNLMKTPSAEHARAYLKSRGLTSEIAARWRIGYAPDSFDACLNWSAEQGFRKEEAIKSGLIKLKDEPDPSVEQTDQFLRKARAYDRFRDRLMFPICNEAGEVIAFSGRVLTAEAKAAKYVNSPETPLFTKGRVLFGLHMAKPALLEAGFAIVCEGQIDLITAYESGITNVTAPQGTAFTDQQARILKRHVEEVVLCFDSDSAGQQAAERSLPALLEANVSVRVATMPPGEDPDSLIRTRGAAVFAERIGAAQDFFDFQIERLGATFDLNTPLGKKQFAGRMAESVSLLTEPVLRQAIVSKVSARIGLAAKDFGALLKRRVYSTNRPKYVDLAGSPSDDAAATGDPTATDGFDVPPKSISELIQVCLQNAEARQWLLSKPWREVLPRVPSSELLQKSLAAQMTPFSDSKVAALLSSLSPQEETYVTGLLMRRPAEKIKSPERTESIENPLRVAQDGWNSLERSVLKERFAILQGRLVTGGMSLEEHVRLEKEILDLQLRLKQVARL